MGGDFSHEYHFVSPIGEEKLQTCLTCGKSSKDASDDQLDAPDSSTCKDCQNGREVEKKLGIEVNFYYYENILSSKRIIQFYDFLGGSYLRPRRHLCKETKSASFKRQQANSNANGMLRYWSNSIDWGSY